MRTKLLCFIIASVVAAGAQMTSPLTVTVPPGQSPTTMVDLTPATATQPCLTLAQMPANSKGAVRLCAQIVNSIPQVFIDAGSGYVSQMGPKGDPGAQGATGPQGTQGQAGVAGPQGAQGQKGDAGAQGLQGVAGLPGAQGEPGMQGVSGLPGAKGDPGTQGSDGQPGKDGAQGPMGSQGPAGTQGPAGQPGKDAPFPFTIVCSGTFSLNTDGTVKANNMICNPFTVPK